MKAGNMGAADNAAVGPRPEGARLGSCGFGPHPQVLLPVGIRRRPVPGHQPACPQLAQARSLRKGFAGRQSVVVSRCSDWGEKIPAHLSAQGAGNFGHRGHQLEMFSGRKEAEGGAAAVALTPPSPTHSSPPGHLGPNLGKATPWSLQHSAPGRCQHHQHAGGERLRGPEARHNPGLSASAQEPVGQPGEGLPPRAGLWGVAVKVPGNTP